MDGSSTTTKNKELDDEVDKNLNLTFLIKLSEETTNCEKQDNTNVNNPDDDCEKDEAATSQVSNNGQTANNNHNEDQNSDLADILPNTSDTMNNNDLDNDDIEKLISKKKVITIVLLGESGVGKSTFINAFVNYLTFENIDAAKASQVKCLIPVSFTSADPTTCKPRKVTFGKEDGNENVKNTDKSATQYPKCYKFEDDNIILNIIDTPGIGDTDGVDINNRNMQNILDFISNYREINAFCFVLKPNNARVDVLFKYCLFQLFTHLNKSAANNILFLFTNSRSTDYLPGDSGPALISILDKIRVGSPDVDIPYNKNTVYCFDSEAFRYLVASVPPNNIQFDPELKAVYVESWKRSVVECERLFEHITQLPAHKVMDTLSLNTAKQNIQLLTKPLADITKNIADNIKLCHTYERSPDLSTLSNDMLQYIDLKCVPLREPYTTCESYGCRSRRMNSPCHAPCYLSYDDGSILGNSGLLYCKLFNKYGRKDLPTKNNKHMLQRVVEYFISPFTQNYYCDVCGHSFAYHMHVAYETITVLKTLYDKSHMPTTNTIAEGPEATLQLLKRRSDELNAESSNICQSLATFYGFLANNSLSPVVDAFENYVQHLVDSQPHDAADDSLAINDPFKQLLEKYRSAKRDILGIENNDPMITVENVNDWIDKLSKMKINGPVFSKILEQMRWTKLKHHTDHSVIKYNPLTSGVLSLKKLIWKIDNLN